MEITIDRLEKYAKANFYITDIPQAKPLYFMLKEVNELFDPNSIKVIYPKNLFLNDKQVELFLFTDKKQIIKVTYEKGEVHTDLYFSKNLSMYINISDYCRSLNIRFIDGDEIEFNSKNDTDHANTGSFNDLIVAIWKVLLSGDKTVRDWIDMVYIFSLSRMLFYF